jgi:hypothetical protein
MTPTEPVKFLWRGYKVMRPMMTGCGSHLRFRGKFLLRAGFTPGCRFDLICPRKGTLILTIREN